MVQLGNEVGLVLILRLQLPQGVSEPLQLHLCGRGWGERRGCEGGVREGCGGERGVGMRGEGVMEMCVCLYDSKQGEDLLRAPLQLPTSQYTVC